MVARVLMWLAVTLGFMALTIQVEPLALAQTAQVPTERYITWVPSLEYTTGGTFDETAIQSYTLYCNGALVREIANDFTRRYLVTTSLLGAGDHVCALSETVDGIESLVSNQVSFPLGQLTPGSPTLTVE